MYSLKRLQLTLRIFNLMVNPWLHRYMFLCTTLNICFVWWANSESRLESLLEIQFYHQQILDSICLLNMIKCLGYAFVLKYFAESRFMRDLLEKLDSSLREIAISRTCIISIQFHLSQHSHKMGVWQVFMS